MRNDASYKALLLITWSADKPWPFAEGLREAGLDCDVLGADFPRGYNNVFSKITQFWTRYIRIGIRAFLIRREYDVILGWQQAAGLVYGLLKRLFRSRSPKLIVMKFTYPARKNPLIAGIRRAFVKYVLGAVDALWCLSTAEVGIRTRMFDYPEERARFVPLSLTDISDSGIEFDGGGAPGDYILSIGNERDYAFLVEAMRTVDFPLKIVCQPYNVEGIDLPPHVEAHHVFGEEVKALYRGARFVVVPMKDPNRPGGESVIIESLSFGKPIIITRTVTSVDYVNPMENGLLVEPGDREGMRRAVERLWNRPDLVEEMGRKNRELYRSTYSTRAVARNVKRLVLDVIGARER